MNKLTQIEREYLNLMKPYLKENVNEQIVINILRTVELAAERKGQLKGRHGYQGDTTWTDDQLMK